MGGASVARHLWPPATKPHGPKVVHAGSRPVPRPPACARTEVAAHGVAPCEAPGPGGAACEVLVEQVVAAVEEQGAVGVIAVLVGWVWGEVRAG